MGMEQNMERGFTRYWWYQMTSGWLQTLARTSVTSKSSQTRPWAHDLTSRPGWPASDVTNLQMLHLARSWSELMGKNGLFWRKNAGFIAHQPRSILFINCTRDGRDKVRPFGSDHWLGAASDNSQCETVNKVSVLHSDKISVQKLHY